LTGVDVAPPDEVRVTTPRTSQGQVQVTGTAPDFTVTIVGTAHDLQSGMVGGLASVTLALSPDTPPEQRIKARPARNPGDFADWTADVKVPSLGVFPLYVWATDAAGNPKSTSTPPPPPWVWGFEAVNVWRPDTLDKRLSPSEYLQDLIAFAADNIDARMPDLQPEGVSGPLLDSLLAQPITAISATPPAAAVEEPVNELRVPIEVLRTHMASSGIPASDAGQDRYLWAAYQALLAGIGTSYTELREARGAGDPDRQKLADRLGIPLYGISSADAGATPPPRHDQLDAITLGPPADGAAGTVTEQALQDLFGLAVTSLFNPAQPAPDPMSCRWCQWQLEAQRALWQRQDRQPPAPVAYTAVIDPDVMTEADIKPGGQQRTQVLALLGQRMQQLSGQAAALQQCRDKPAADGGLSRLLDADGGPGADKIRALHDKDQQGTDITADLAAAGLDRTGFVYLVELQELTAAPGGVITDAEWDNAVDVLVGAYRRQHYQEWLAVEHATQQPGTPQDTQQPAVVLSPDTFTAGEDPPTAPLRVDPRARRDWLQTLRARTLQRQSSCDGMTGLAAATEQAALPVLRDALLSDIARESGTTGEDLTSLYQTDVLVGGALTTTRVEQAITSLQTLIQAVRDGTRPVYSADGPLALRGPAGQFDSDWAWMGTIGSWKAATTTFLFPEAYLDPSQFTRSPAPPDHFATLRDDDLSSSSPDIARSADTYMTAITDVIKNALGTDTAGLDFTALSYDQSHLNLSGMQQISARLEQHDPGLAVEVFWAVPMLIAQRLHAGRRYRDALDWMRLVPFDRLGNEAAGNPAQTAPDLSLPAGWPHLTLPGQVEPSPLDPFTLVTKPLPERPYPFLRATGLAIAGCTLDWADFEFTADTDESITRARSLYRSALTLLDSPQFQPLKPADPRNGTYQIPIWKALRTRAASQLDKIRQDRNIAGLVRPRGQFAGVTIPQPTPYRFKVLLARAQQLTQQAASLEAEFLSAAEKADNKALTEADAAQTAGLAAAHLTVNDAQIKQAHDAIAAAGTQQAKAAAMVSTLSAAIAAPLNQYENALLGNYSDMRYAQDFIAHGDMTITVGNAAASCVTPQGIGGAVAMSIGATEKFIAQILANEYQKSMQENQLYAGLENRRQEWRLQLAGAQQDALVAAAQVTTANDQLTIATAERDVTALQLDQANARLKQLLGQFTNAKLYYWLSGTLTGIYQYYLQHATATARLAEDQLAFERAEPAQALIRADYWEPPAKPSLDVRGLTGAERLAQDLAKLEEYALSTDRRQLNISQTFSLAQLAPIEFLDFKTTGQIGFATPSTLFDQDFPGHYHRLIRQAKLSVVALVPPSRGIRATLASTGISRVTTQTGAGFGEVILCRDPSVIGLTSPVDASGVFAVDLQPDMLLPFEGSGVDTTWELTLLPAANPFDFRTISDVLLTIDYTALSDFNYQTQVIYQLNAARDRTADLVFSLARDFPDQWYTLHNPDPANPGPRTATVTVRAVDFPPNLDPASPLLTDNIAIRLSGTRPLPRVQVTIGRTAGSTSYTGTPITDENGTASTRRGGNWATQLKGLDPVGDWTLTFQPPPEQAAADHTLIDTLFGPDGLDDIVLLIGWRGQAPAWPA
jgi:hypothetical protein